MAKTYDYDIGIIGGGAAGLTVASGAAQLGAKVVLIEKEKALGGDCLHFGCVPSKTLIKTAKVYHDLKTVGHYGLPPVELHRVDFRKVTQRIRSVIETIQKHDSEERFCSLGAKVVFGNPGFVDPHIVQCGEKTLSAGKWVIATGASPLVPAITGLSETPHITNRDIFSLEKLPESMIVLGGGPIGVEMSQAFSRLGTLVSVVDMAPQILPREDEDMAAVVMERMSAEGVRFYLGHTVESTKNEGGQREVTLKAPSGKAIRLKAETLLVALGRKPNSQGLGLEDIGISVNPRGIDADQRLRTSQKHIFAAGDVNGGYQFTHTAGYEGSIVISNAIFHLPRKVDYTWIPWCTYCDPELASIGMNEKAARAAGQTYTVWTESFDGNDRNLAEGGDPGRIKLLLNDSGTPIGVQIVGPRAGDLIIEWVAALNGKTKLSTLAGAIHPYPTLGEINKRVAGNYLSSKIFSEKVKKGLKFFFNLKGRACGE